jgi:hypothetical protein
MTPRPSFRSCLPGIRASSQAIRSTRPNRDASCWSPARCLLLPRKVVWRWSLDHLFLDQDGVPTLVEVKRGTDTRIRREVVGQMLDYAANGVVYWPLETIRASFGNTCAQAKLDPDQALLEFLVGTPTRNSSGSGSELTSRPATSGWFSRRMRSRPSSGAS